MHFLVRHLGSCWHCKHRGDGAEARLCSLDMALFAQDRVSGTLMCTGNVAA